MALAPCPFCAKPLYVKRGKINPYARCVTEDCFGSKMPVVSIDVPADVEAWNTRIAASQPDREVVAWRIKPSDTLFLVGETITDEPAVAEIWRKAGCEVEALSLLSVQVDVE